MGSNLVWYSKKEVYSVGREMDIVYVTCHMAVLQERRQFG